MPVEVSIIICTYNPDKKKLLSTVIAAACQKKVDFEIILSDDGSENNYFDSIRLYFKRIGFRNYSFIENKKNIGTVKNLLGAVKHAKGEYIFFNSPGDILFDENAMSDFYRYAKNQKADVVFGDYIPYYIKDNIICYSELNKPEYASAYQGSFRNYKSAFFTIEGIMGASYFRSREFTVESLSCFENISRYTEDGPTTAYALANNLCIHYFSRKIVWYEYGSGISTNGDKKWERIIFDDIMRSYRAIHIANPHDRYIKAGMYYMEHYGDKYLALLFAAKYPIISIRRRIAKKNKKRVLLATKQEEDYLKALLLDSEEMIHGSN